jgi:UDP-glucose 4,6-dehydratase
MNINHKLNMNDKKNILITGGEGFIGGWVVLKLVKDFPNYNIYVLDKLDYCSCQFLHDEIKYYKNYHFIKGFFYYI